MVIIMKQLFFIILVICILLMFSCQAGAPIEDSAETDSDYLDAAWQETTNEHQTESTGGSTSATKERGDETAVISEKPQLVVENTESTNTTPTSTTPPKEHEVTDPYTPAVTIPPEAETTIPAQKSTETTSIEVVSKETHPIVTKNSTEMDSYPTDQTDPPESIITKPPEAAFDINYWISFAKDYAGSVGLKLDDDAIWCWDNPTTASSKSKYLQRDLCGMLDRYARNTDITVVWIWAEPQGNNVWNIFIGYA